jgi:hypothetical protein
MIEKIKQLYNSKLERKLLKDRVEYDWTLEEQNELIEKIGIDAYERAVNEPSFIWPPFHVAVGMVACLVAIKYSGLPDWQVNILGEIAFLFLTIELCFFAIYLSAEVIVKHTLTRDKQKTLTLVDEWAAHLKEKERNQ